MTPQREIRAFLFADLRGYTAYTERHGDDAARELLARYRELVRAEIAGHHGAEIRTEGDSFYVVFDSIADAVLAGLAIARRARAPETGDPIRVGVGIHAGEVIDDDREGIVSSAVNVAARVCATADAGEVLVTDTVRSLTRTTLPVRFASRGRRRLKGIPEPIPVYRVDTADAPVQPTRRRTMGGVAAGGVVALVALGLALVALRPAPTGAPAAGTSPSGSATATHDLSRFTDPGEFPNDAEQALLDQLPSRIATSCERADAQAVPEFAPGEGPRGAPYAEPLRVRAGVSCLTGSTRVTYWQKTFERGITTEDLFFNLVIKRSLEEGSCEARHRAYEAWEAGAHNGHLMCFPREDTAVIEWSYADADIYAVASRRDGDMDELLAWWRDVGRLFSR